MRSCRELRNWSKQKHMSSSNTDVVTDHSADEPRADLVSHRLPVLFVGSFGNSLCWSDIHPGYLGGGGVVFVSKQISYELKLRRERASAVERYTTLINTTIIPVPCCVTVEQRSGDYVLPESFVICL